MKEQATYLAYAGGWRAVRLMPERMAYAMFDQIADQQWRTQGPSVRRLEANLSRVVGPVAPDELRELSRAGMRSYMRYWCDAFRLPGWDAERIDTFEMRHPERLSDPLASGRGVVAALPHMGNWDHAGAWCSQHISPVNTVAEKLEPEQLYTAFVDFRDVPGDAHPRPGGPGCLPASCGARSSPAGWWRCWLTATCPPRGSTSRSSARPRASPPGPAALAVDTGASLVPVTLFWEGHNVAEILPEIVPPATGERDERIRVTTQAVADALAGGIAEHPSDWHMLQRLWLADLDPRRAWLPGTPPSGTR